MCINSGLGKGFKSHYTPNGGVYMGGDGGVHWLSPTMGPAKNVKRVKRPTRFSCIKFRI